MTKTPYSPIQRIGAILMVLVMLLTSGILIRNESATNTVSAASNNGNNGKPYTNTAANSDEMDYAQDQLPMSVGDYMLWKGDNSTGNLQDGLITTDISKTGLNADKSLYENNAQSPQVIIDTNKIAERMVTSTTSDTYYVANSKLTGWGSNFNKVLERITDTYDPNAPQGSSGRDQENLPSPASADSNDGNYRSSSGTLGWWICNNAATYHFGHRYGDSGVILFSGTMIGDDQKWSGTSSQLRLHFREVGTDWLGNTYDLIMYVTEIHAANSVYDPDNDKTYIIRNNVFHTSSKYYNVTGGHNGKLNVGNWPMTLWTYNANGTPTKKKSYETNISYKLSFIVTKPITPAEMNSATNLNTLLNNKAINGTIVFRITDLDTGVHGGNVEQLTSYAATWRGWSLTGKLPGWSEIVSPDGDEINGEANYKQWAIKEWLVAYQTYVNNPSSTYQNYATSENHAERLWNLIINNNQTQKSQWRADILNPSGKTYNFETNRGDLSYGFNTNNISTTNKTGNNTLIGYTPESHYDASYIRALKWRRWYLEAFAVVANELNPSYYGRNGSNPLNQSAHVFHQTTDDVQPGSGYKLLSMIDSSAIAYLTGAYLYNAAYNQTITLPTINNGTETISSIDQLAGSAFLAAGQKPTNAPSNEPDYYYRYAYVTAEKDTTKSTSTTTYYKVARTNKWVGADNGGPNPTSVIPHTQTSPIPITITERESYTINGKTIYGIITEFSVPASQVASDQFSFYGHCLGSSLSITQPSTPNSNDSNHAYRSLWMQCEGTKILRGLNTPVYVRAKDGDDIPIDTLDYFPQTILLLHDYNQTADNKLQPFFTGQANGGGDDDRNAFTALLRVTKSASTTAAIRWNGPTCTSVLFQDIHVTKDVTKSFYIPSSNWTNLSDFETAVFGAASAGGAHSYNCPPSTAQMSSMYWTQIDVPASYRIPLEATEQPDFHIWDDEGQDIMVRYLYNTNYCYNHNDPNSLNYTTNGDGYIIKISWTPQFQSWTEDWTITYTISGQRQGINFVVYDITENLSNPNLSPENIVGTLYLNPDVLTATEEEDNDNNNHIVSYTWKDLDFMLIGHTYRIIEQEPETGWPVYNGLTICPERAYFDLDMSGSATPAVLTNVVRKNNKLEIQKDIGTTAASESNNRAGYCFVVYNKTTDEAYYFKTNTNGVGERTNAAFTTYLDANGNALANQNLTSNRVRMLEYIAPGTYYIIERTGTYGNHGGMLPTGASMSTITTSNTSTGLSSRTGAGTQGTWNNSSNQFTETASGSDYLYIFNVTSERLNQTTTDHIRFVVKDTPLNKGNLDLTKSGENADGTSNTTLRQNAIFKIEYYGQGTTVLTTYWMKTNSSGKGVIGTYQNGTWTPNSGSPTLLTGLSDGRYRVTELRTESGITNAYVSEWGYTVTNPAGDDPTTLTQFTDNNWSDYPTSYRWGHYITGGASGASNATVATEPYSEFYLHFMTTENQVPTAHIAVTNKAGAVPLTISKYILDADNQQVPVNDETIPGVVQGNFEFIIRTQGGTSRTLSAVNYYVRGDYSNSYNTTIVGKRNLSSTTVSSSAAIYRIYINGVDITNHITSSTGTTFNLDGTGQAMMTTGANVFVVYIASTTNVPYVQNAQIVGTGTNDYQASTTLPQGTYYVEEIPKPGYKMPEVPKSVTITSTPQSVSFLNIPTALKVNKQIASNSYGSAIGWSFEIYDANPTTTNDAALIMTLGPTTGTAANASVSTPLGPGTYYVKEIVPANSGYDPNVAIQTITIPSTSTGSAATTTATLANPASTTFTNRHLVTKYKVIKQIAAGTVTTETVEGWLMALYDADEVDTNNPRQIISTSVNVTSSSRYLNIPSSAGVKTLIAVADGNNNIIPLDNVQPTTTNGNITRLTKPTGSTWSTGTYRVFYTTVANDAQPIQVRLTDSNGEAIFEDITYLCGEDPELTIIEEYRVGWIGPKFVADIPVVNYNGDDFSNGTNTSVITNQKWAGLTIEKSIYQDATHTYHADESFTFIITPALTSTPNRRLQAVSYYTHGTSADNQLNGRVNIAGTTISNSNFDKIYKIYITNANGVLNDETRNLTTNAMTFAMRSSIPAGRQVYIVYTTSATNTLAVSTAETVTTDTSGYATLTLAPGLYQIEEVPKNGYKMPEAPKIITFGVNNVTASFNNIPTALKVTKTLASDSTGDARNWYFNLYDVNPDNDANAVLIATLGPTTGNIREAFVEYDIGPGTYYVTEIAQVQNGYEVVGGQQVTIDGTSGELTTSTTWNPANLTFVNRRHMTSYKVIKRLADGTQATVSGWFLALYDGADAKVNQPPTILSATTTNNTANATTIALPSDITITSLLAVAYNGTLIQNYEPHQNGNAWSITATEGTFATGTYTFYYMPTSYGAQPIAVGITDSNGEAIFANIRLSTPVNGQPSVFVVEEQRPGFLAPITLFDDEITLYNDLNFGTAQNPINTGYVTNATYPNITIRKQLTPNSTGSVAGWEFLLYPESEYQQNGPAYGSVTFVNPSLTNQIQIASHISEYPDHYNKTLYVTVNGVKVECTQTDTVITLASNIPVGATVELVYERSHTATNGGTLRIGPTVQEGAYGVITQQINVDTATTYRIEEIPKPGYRLVAPQQVTLTPSHDQTVTFTNDNHGALTIQKTIDSASESTMHRGVEGWKFIYTEASNVTAGTTLVKSEKLPMATAYTASGLNYTFNLSSTNGLIQAIRVGNQTYTETDFTANGNNIAQFNSTWTPDINAAFVEVIYIDLAAISGSYQIVSTNNEGLYETEIAPGTYYVEEIVEFDWAQPAGQTVVVPPSLTGHTTFFNTLGLSIHIVKTDEETGLPMSGIEFYLVPKTAANQNGAFFRKVTNIATTAQQSTIDLTTVASDYDTSSNPVIQLYADGVLLNSTDYSYANGVITVANAYKGHTFDLVYRTSLTQATGVEHFTTNANGEISAPIAIGEYLLQEAPVAGYVFKPVQTINVDGTQSPFEVEVENQPDVTDLVIQKNFTYGGQAYPEAGAEFDVYLTAYGTYDNTPAGYRWHVTIATNGAVTIPDVKPGTYTIHQTAGRAGYAFCADQTVAIAVSDYTTPVTVQLNNELLPGGAIIIDKVDLDGNPLAGVGMKLEYSDDNGASWHLVQQFDANAFDPENNSPYPVGTTTSAIDNRGIIVTDSNGHVEFRGLNAGNNVKYRVTEVFTNNGYALMAEPIWVGTLPVTSTVADSDMAAVRAYGTEGVDWVDGGLDGTNHTIYYYTIKLVVENNKTGVLLPKTGGNGFGTALPVALAGLAVTTALLIIFRKKKKEDDNAETATETANN